MANKILNNSDYITLKEFEKDIRDYIIVQGNEMKKKLKKEKTCIKNKNLSYV